MASTLIRDAHIYILVDPRDNAVRYVGRTVNPHDRLKQHLGKNTGKAKQEWLIELAAAGLSPVFKVVETVPYKRCKLAEQFWIVYHLYKGAKLTNYQLNHMGEKSIYYAAVLRYVGNESEFTKPSQLVLDI